MAVRVKKRGHGKKKLHSGVTLKQYSDRAHTKKRLEERYGVKMNREMLLAIKKAIKSGQAVFSDEGYQTKTRRVFKNVVPGNPDIPVVYSFKTDSPVTVLNKKKADGR